MEPAKAIDSHAAADGDALAATTGQSLDRALFHGIAWTAVWRWAAQGVSWAVMLYAARVLSPEDFGLAAMTAVPIGLARMVEDLGLDAVIVQDRTLSHEDIAQLGGLALFVGVALVLLFNALAVPIAGFFKEPAVAGLIGVLSLTFVLDAIQILPRALLQRDLQFRRLAWINGLQLMTGAVALATFATLGFAYWSLVLNTLVAGTVATLVLVALRPHRIERPRQLRKLSRSLISCSHMLGSRAAWYGYSNLDQTFIGRVLGKADLGVYSFAMTFAMVAIQEVTSLLSRVVPGVFSTVQADRVELRRYYLMLTEALSYLTMPCATGLALVADDFVLLLLGPKWEAVVTPLRILCAYAAFNSAQALLSHVLLWTGRFRVNMLLNGLALIVLAIAYSVGVRWDVAGVAWALAIGFPVSTIPGFYIVGRILDMPIRHWLLALTPATVACVAMSGAVLVCRSQLAADLPHWSRLALQAGFGAVAYLVVMLALYRNRLMAILRTIRGHQVSQ